MAIPLCILDQSPVPEGVPQTVAINQTVELAVMAEQWGYTRFWVSEHHNSKAFASASPEILIPVIAAKTSRIRVGSAGVLLGYYSPFKIAEQFKSLTALFPDRIDLGIGRAPGGGASVVRALGGGAESADVFSKIGELKKYLELRSGSMITVPSNARMPQLWVLGTSTDSAYFAAKHGLPYSFGAFIHDGKMAEASEIYRKNFVASDLQPEPLLNVAVFCICAETTEIADNLSQPSAQWFVETFLRGKDVPIPRNGNTFHVMADEMAMVERRRKSVIYGDVLHVVKSLTSVVERTGADELTIVTLTDDYAARQNSYALIAKAWGT